MILVVEDEDDVREELVEMLELRRFDVRGADGVRSGLSAIRVASAPLTLLTDLRLRDGSGVDLIREIAIDPALRPKVLRAVLMTGHIDLTEQIQHDLERKEIPVLFKPIDFDLLLPLLTQDALT